MAEGGNTSDLGRLGMDMIESLDIQLKLSEGGGKRQEGGGGRRYVAVGT